MCRLGNSGSLSARRAWIEITIGVTEQTTPVVALRKESVDRNKAFDKGVYIVTVALRKESVDRNPIMQCFTVVNFGRSPQGERG